MDFSDILWIAVMLLTAFAGSRKKLRRSMEEKTSASQPTPSQSVDSPFGEDADTFDLEEDWFEEDADEAYAGTSVEEQSSSYFTYETIDPQPVQAPEMAAVSKKEESNVDEVLHPENNLADGFNLRQAIIYQTIMENDYLADIK